uniref:Bm10085, isoform a n=1 Tax=Brugia malayi TaxID=6279 RepID=A0A1I9G2T9_BRUMA|nr:Bm10085, isoform a [Brugia malayi]
MPRPEQKPVPPSIRQTYSCSHLIEFQHDTPKQMHTVTNEQKYPKNNYARQARNKLTDDNSHRTWADMITDLLIDFLLILHQLKSDTNGATFPKSIEDGWLIDWRVVADEKNAINLGGNFEKSETRFRLRVEDGWKKEVAKSSINDRNDDDSIDGEFKHAIRALRLSGRTDRIVNNELIWQTGNNRGTN